MPALRLRLAALVAAAIAAVAVLPAATDAAAKPLRILVSNDDGVNAAGLDALVQGLRRLPDVKLTVVAPAIDQSGTGGKTTPGPLKVARTTTASGYPAIAVTGYPADAVDYALRKVVKPTQVDLVIAGINRGANLGPFVDLSGTVGAARAGAAHGLPALASSQGTAETTDFSDGVAMTLRWLEQNRTKLKRGTVQNLNTPQCSAGHVRGMVLATQSTTLPSGVNPFAPVDCDQTRAATTNELDDYLWGFAPLTRIRLSPAA